MRLIARCLEKDATDRPTASEVMREVLPSLDDTLEWPPPGLGRTSSLGRRFTWWARLLVLATAALAVALAVQLPGTHSASGWWNDWRAGSVVVGDSVGPSSGVVALWSLFVVCCCGAIIGAGIALARILTQIATLVSQARQRGWQRSTLWDVISDPDSRTGALLSASGEFLELDLEARIALQRRRRRDWQLTTVAAGVTAGALGVWAVSVLVGDPLSPPGGPLAQWPAVFSVVATFVTSVSYTHLTLPTNREV